jgi:single-strand DNA-binding protein
MATGNNITLVGNLTRDPELRFTPSGQPLAQFGMAVNRRWQNRQGEWQEDTSFFNVVVWGDHGENASDSLGKGDRVIVTGRLDQRSWETEQGEKRSVIEVIADEVGPSLRWATAEVKKSERRSSGDGGGARDRDRGGSDSTGSNAADAEATVGAGSHEVGGDEEPF